MTGLGITTPATETPTDPTGSAGVHASAHAKSSKPQTIREFEQAMRELGYSKREAIAIGKHGFKAVNASASAEEDQAKMAELAALIERNTSLLKDSL